MNYSETDVIDYEGVDESVDYASECSRFASAHIEHISDENESAFCRFAAMALKVVDNARKLPVFRHLMVADSGCSISISKSRLRFLLGLVDQLYFKVGIRMCAGECGADDAGFLLVHERRDPDDLRAGVYSKTVMALEVHEMDNEHMTLISTTQCTH